MHVCSDGLDNDNDGLTDYPRDPGCSSPTDSTETNSMGPQCDNGINDDGQTGTDFRIDGTGDPDCVSVTDDREAADASCGNGVREGSEVCDDGSQNGQPNRCNASCTGTTTPVCGNNVVESGETCDDGSQNGQPGRCNNSCNGTRMVQ